jgi:citrate synthase
MVVALESMLDSEQAARYLGIQRATLYVYASRGLLEPVRDQHSKKSLFRLADLEKLVGRSQKNRFVDLTLPAITTSITTLGPNGPIYRGIPVATLVGSQRFESVAELLWQIDTGPWVPLDISQDPARLASESIKLVVAELVAQDPSVTDTDPVAIATFARQLMATVVGALVPLNSSFERDGRYSPISTILAGALFLSDERAKVQRAIDALLIIFADHELSPSTLVVRIAASECSGLANSFLAGLGVLSTYLQRSISKSFELLVDAGHVGAEHALKARLKRGEPIPAFGHERGVRGDKRQDPRFELLMRHVYGIASPDQRRCIETLIAVAAERELDSPGLRFAVAALTWVGEAHPHVGADILLLSRMAGWTAHYIEELVTTPRRFRMRPTYITVDARLPDSRA